MRLIFTSVPGILVGTQAYAAEASDGPWARTAVSTFRSNRAVISVIDLACKYYSHFVDTGPENAPGSVNVDVPARVAFENLNRATLLEELPPCTARTVVRNEK